MQVYAILCDAARVRENLLHTVAAGITSIKRREFPATLNADLALMFLLHPAELGDTHKLRVRVQSEDGEQVAQADAEFGVQGPGAKPGQQLAMPMVLPLQGLSVPTEGGYSIDVLVDAQHQASWSFTAWAAPDQ